MRAASLTGVLSLCVSSALVAACVDTYCQSGPKYGTQCYGSSQLDPPGSRGTRPGDAALFRQGPPSTGSAWKAGLIPRSAPKPSGSSAKPSPPKPEHEPLSFGAGLKRPGTEPASGDAGAPPDPPRPTGE
ncbi:MAG TPA: hypothetical protein VHE30_23165 [Polyangiaceae bacterium]|nr:hypothetical protein [Polyangiaceae bacterium]